MVLLLLCALGSVLSASLNATTKKLYVPLRLAIVNVTLIDKSSVSGGGCSALCIIIARLCVEHLIACYEWFVAGWGRPGELHCVLSSQLTLDISRCVCYW